MKENYKELKKITGKTIFILYFLFIIYKITPSICKVEGIGKIAFFLRVIAEFYLHIFLVDSFWYLLKTKYIYEGHKVKFTQMIFANLLFQVPFFGFNGLDFFKIDLFESMIVLSIVSILKNNYKIVFKYN